MNSRLDYLKEMYIDSLVQILYDKYKVQADFKLTEKELIIDFRNKFNFHISIDLSDVCNMLPDQLINIVCERYEQMCFERCR